MGPPRRLAVAVFASCAACGLRCAEQAPMPPVIATLSPMSAPGGEPIVVTISGAELGGATAVLVGDGRVAPDTVSETQVTATLPAQRRGLAQVRVVAGALTSAPVSLQIGNSPPQISGPGPQLVLVGDEVRVRIETYDFDGDPLTLTARDLPEGASLEPAAQQVVFRPSAAQGDQTFVTTLVVDDGIDTASVDVTLQAVRVLPPLLVDRLAPSLGPGGRRFMLEVFGDGFSPGTQVRLRGAPLPTVVRSAMRLEATVPASPRGSYEITVTRDGEIAGPLTLAIGNAPPTLVLPGNVTVDEETTREATVEATDLEGDPVRIGLFDLPPGAQFDEATGRFSFRPDFIQGGEAFVVRALADDGTDTSTGSFTVTVLDTIQPPWPEIVSSDDRGDYVLLVLRQPTDDFLDSPGHAGRAFEARVSIPTAASAAVPYPVRVFLHGFGGGPYTGGQGDQFRIYPHDPDNTYWWGYSASAPDSVSPGPVPPYTARRVLHLLQWVLTNYDGANPEQAYVNGASMGGTGASTLGLLWARHFAMVETSIGQTIARNHRPSRIQQLSGHYGAPQDNLPDDLGIPVWDRLDFVRALAELPEARQQFIFTRHGKDDPTIHFGAAAIDSPLVALSWLDALQTFRVGHFAVWDEGAHGPADPVMGSQWWDGGWNRIADPETFLGRNLAFVAFTNTDPDGDPGDGTGNGNQPWSDERGFAGDRNVPGDTGWTGDLVGTYGRYLRWDSRRIVDTWDRFEVPLRAKVGTGKGPPRAGYPPKGDRYDGPLPIHADVTPRRVQAFRCRPGERIAWRFGATNGEVIAGDDGSLTVPQLPLTADWTVLELTRAEPN